MRYTPILLFSVCFPDVIDMYFIYIVEIPFVICMTSSDESPTVTQYDWFVDVLWRAHRKV